MAPVRNGVLIFKEVPTGYPEPGKTTVFDDSKTIDLDNVPLNGSVLVKTLMLSVDPYMRARMREPGAKAYTTVVRDRLRIRWVNRQFLPSRADSDSADGFEFDWCRLTGRSIGLVLRSEHESFKPGDHITGPYARFEQYTIPENPSSYKKIVKEPGLDWPVYIGAAGMPGKSAYFAWKKYADAKKGETVFVTGGAGPVGTMVIQLAKADGMKVIASAGTEEKVQECRDMGADVVFNYKTTSTEEVLEKEGPLNVYWDNVGGSVLDAALAATAPHARIISCGMISEYNAPLEGTRLKLSVLTESRYDQNLWAVFGRSLHIHGFVVYDLSTPELEEEFYNLVPKKLASGEWKHREDITRGLENAGQAILDVQKGTNFGKKVVIVADE
ncbi:hypothetical protein V5O48_012017 [Marasmius crinis-equi]|uniref:Enoyl reductase (ER) domain-containing protein n=1 Tax=Marasmius crinis-equi TaxID=585013 RepID=A0ABR3F3Z5_9AGAR